MGQALSPREKEVLTIILRNVRSKGYPPSVREIGEAIGFLSSSTVHGYLRRLEKKGYLRRDVAKPRALEVLNPPDPNTAPETVDLPVFGRLDPAKPLCAEENRRGTFVLPKHFLGEGNFFVLDLEEDNVVSEGFRPGDMVIVRQQSSACEGDVVVATDGITACVICDYSEQGDPRFPPGQPDAPSAEVAGKLVALVRRIG